MVSVAVAPLARLAVVPVMLLPLTLTVRPLPLALSTFSPAGTTSVTVTLAAALGPALLTTIAKLIVAPAPVPLGVLAVFTTVRSALALTVIVSVPLLLAVLLSGVVVVTVLVALTGPLPGTTKLMVWVLVAPGASVPIVYTAVVSVPPGR
jgi:hypothetical protein